MIRALLALLVVTAALSASCTLRAPRLDAAAHVRLAQLQACDCLSHDGFPTVALYFDLTRWRGEVIVASSAPLSLERSRSLWEESPPHAAVLAHCPHFWGFATSAAASPGGWWYAVELVECIDLACEVPPPVPPEACFIAVTMTEVAP